MVIEHTSRLIVADLRARLARRPDDARLRALTNLLRERSAHFAELWDSHDVNLRRGGRKTIVHPVVGRLDLDCEVLFAPEHDQWLIIHSAPVGSVAWERLALLRVIGVQDMDPQGPRSGHQG